MNSRETEPLVVCEKAGEKCYKGCGCGIAHVFRGDICNAEECMIGLKPIPKCIPTGEETK